MATIRQRKAAKLVIENLQANKPLNGGEIVANSGYGSSMSKNPQVVLNSKGVVNELHRMGFDTEKAKEVVGEILQFGSDDTPRLKAADMIFKVNGDYAPEKRLNVNLDGTPTERTRELGDRLLKLLGR